MSQQSALIVDDNPNNAKILAMLLKGQGIESITVNHPTRLDTLIPTLPGIDVVFLDLEMPMLNGFRVMDKLRADSSFDGVPIIAYSVHVSELDAVHKYGFDGFLGKPVDSDKFPAILEKILHGEQVWIS